MTTLKRYVIKLFKIDFGIQVLIIGTVICSFLLSVCVNKIAFVAEHAVFYTVSFAGSGACLVAWGKRFFEFVKEKSLEKTTADLQHKWGGIVSVFYCILIRLPQFGDIPRDDGSVYYRELAKACNMFDFTWSQFLNGFRIAAHPTQGYMSVLAIGEFLVPNKYVGVMLINLILSMISAYCICGILTEFLENIPYKYIVISSMIMTSVPLYMGTFSYFNPDMGVVYFLSMAVYCFLKQKYLLFIFSLIFLSLTKEIGMVITAAFAVGILFRLLWEKKTIILKKINIKNVLILFFLIFIFAALIGGGVYIVLGGNLWNYHREEIQYFSTFGFHPEFIGFKLKEYFLLNFNWIAALIISVSCVFRMKKRNNMQLSSERKSVFYGCLLVYVTVAGFYCIYITFQHPRYTVILDVILWASALILLGHEIGDFQKKTKQSLILLLSLLLFSQSYFTIDPVSLLAFNKKDTGRGGQILEIYSDFIGYFGPGDVLIYNNHYRYLERAYVRLFDDIDYDGNMDIIRFNDYGTLGGESEELFWDMERKIRTWESNENTVVFRVVNGHDLDEKENKRKNAVYVWIPQFGGDRERELEIVAEYYDINCHGEIIIPGGGKIEYWQCRLRGE